MLKLKNLLFLGALLLYSSLSFAQDALKEEPPQNWFHLDEAQDQFRGVSTELAYKLVKKKKSSTVIVAVIDSGVDIEHEDLQGKIWINKGEIAGNGKDDDKNGYVDDIHGWDFIGGKDGKDVDHDTYELTRLYVHYSQKFKDKDLASLSKEEKEEYQAYKKIKKDFEKKRSDLKAEYQQFSQISFIINQADKSLQGHFAKETYTKEDLESLESEDDKVNYSAKILLDIMANSGLSLEGLLSEIKEGDEYFEGQLEYGLNPDFDPRATVGDDYSNKTEAGYGNNEVEGPDAEHGTHVAGIIAANRKNKLGAMGVAEDVQIMVIRCVPNGDERDKDVANAIRYAVDNGASIVNMSFGKDYSPDKEIVDQAVQYAAKKGVLLIHAAGNDAKDIDTESNFPTDLYKDGKKSAENWIEVGASSWGEADNFVADFSNFGQKNVDIFAPGTEIYSTIPDSKYRNLQGTSMASPVVAGVAALVKSYFPELTAVQLKDILLKSAIRYDMEVNMPGSDSKKVAFKQLSGTGSIVNAYRAMKMAMDAK